jgi:hypothetical protein
MFAKGLDNWAIMDNVFLLLPAIQPLSKSLARFT